MIDKKKSQRQVLIGKMKLNDAIKKSWNHQTT